MSRFSIVFFLAAACSDPAAPPLPDAPLPDAPLSDAPLPDAPLPSRSLQVTVEVGTGGGRVTSDVPGIDCGATCTAALAGGADVVLTATPPAGSSFVGWRGDAIACGSVPTCTIRMDRDHQVGALFAAAGTASWAKLLGTTGTEPSGVVDKDGFLFVTLSFNGSFAFGGATYEARGRGDILVAKLSPAGDPVWVQQLGGTDADVAEAIATDPTNGDLVVAGGYHSSTIDLGGPAPLDGDGDDLFVARYAAADGAWKWQKRIQTTEGRGTLFNTIPALGVDHRGDVLVAGRFFGQLGLGGEPLDIGNANAAFVAKLDGTSGETAWRKAIGADEQGFISPNGLAVDTRDDDFVLATECGGNADFAGDGPDGNLPTLGLSDGCVAKLAGADGHLLWQQAIGGTGGEELFAVAIAPFHDTVTAIVQVQIVPGEKLSILGHELDGAGTGTDTVVVRMDGSDGSFVWARRFGGEGVELGIAVAALPNGDVVVAGGFTADFQMDAFALHFNGVVEDSFFALLDADAGAVTYAARVGSDDFDHATRVAVFGLTVYGFGAVTGEGSFLGKTLAPPTARSGYGFAVTLP